MDGRKLLVRIIPREYQLTENRCVRPKIPGWRIAIFDRSGLLRTLPLGPRRGRRSIHLDLFGFIQKLGEQAHKGDELKSAFWVVMYEAVGSGIS